MIASDLAMALDPALVMEAMDMTGDPWQLRLLRSSAKRVLLNCHRQSGKSMITGVLAAHTAFYQPGSLILLLSPALRQSQELYRKCLDAYHAMGATVPPDAENKLTLELSNGSRIISLPGKEGTIRGYSGVDLLVIDEAARVPDELYKSVRPMLAVSNGRLLALTTPFGKRGWFYDAWESDQPWERFKVPVGECTRIAPEFIEEEKASLGWFWYTQEYECAFVEATGSLFLYDDISSMLTPDIAPMFATGTGGIH